VFATLIADHAVTRATSNPTIFEGDHGPRAR
jgi:hypothetical protein